MKLFEYDVFDLLLFNEHGRLITEMNGLKDSRINILEDGKDSYVNVLNVFYDEELLKFLGKEVEYNYSDYDKALGKEKTSIVFSKDNSKKCKLIAKGVLYDDTGRITKDYTIEIPNAETIRGIQLGGTSGEFHDFHLKLKINTYSPDGDYFIVHLEDRK